MKRSTLVLVPLCALVSTGALAQTEAAAPAPAPAGDAAAAPAAATEAAPVETAAPSASAEGSRIRFGASAGLGPYLNPGMFAVGVEGRVGYQVNSILGAYLGIGYTDGLGFGGSVSSTGASFSATTARYLRVTAVAEATLGSHFFVAGGAGIANGSWAGGSVGVGTSGASAGASTADGTYPALNARLGLGWGKPNDSGRRTGFNMAVDAQFVFTPGGMGIAPMLVFGFESK